MEFFRRTFKPPVFEDAVKTHRAYLLHVILLTFIFLPIPFLIYLLLYNPPEAMRDFILIAISEVVNLVLYFLLRRGHVRLSSMIHVLVIWSLFAFESVSGSSVYGLTFMLGNGLTITLAGILMGGRAAFAMTFLAIIQGGGLIFAEIQGWTPPDKLDDGLYTYAVSIMLLTIMMSLQRLAAGNAEQALSRARASEERYRLISQISSDYTFSTVLDAEGNMRLNWVAGAFEEITGYTFDEYVKNGAWRAHLHPDDLEQDAQDMQALQQNQRVITEVRTFTKQREIRWVRVYGHPVWDVNLNRLAGIVGAVQDITEHKKVENERENLIAELETKNAELERFTYTVSHDLKSPLVTITGFIGYLEQDAMTGNIDMVKGSIERISAAARKMQALLNDLLELSQVGRLMNTPEDLPFEEIVNEAIDHVRGQLDEHNIIIESQTNYPVVYGDRVRLVEVVQNLIENAAKYSKPDVQSRIEIGANGRDELGRAIFFVRDNGIGIEEQYHERIFGLFNKLNAQSEGTGIGLSLVKRIIEVHDGRIWLESEKDKGATFYFSLPSPQLKE
ncbi:MAG TPA: ATP-binding protein [Anaerolineales bacterium]|nr:ATP-binding protein [Anaerolineales bacterium]